MLPEIPGDAGALWMRLFWTSGVPLVARYSVIPGVQGLQQLPGAGHEEVAPGQLLLVALADLLRVGPHPQLAEQQLEAPDQHLGPGQLPLLQQLPLPAVQLVVPVQHRRRGVHAEVLQGPGEGLPLRPAEVQNGVVQIQKDRIAWGRLLWVEIPPVYRLRRHFARAARD